MNRREILCGAVTVLLAAALAGCGGDGAAPAPDTAEVPAARPLTTDDDTFEANPIYSPDGRWVLFESDAGGSRDIWRLPAAGGEAERLTTDPAFDSAPYWSPDGAAFVFESDRAGSKDLWVLRLDGGAPTRLTDGGGDDGSPTWSPDGTRIAFESNRGGEGIGLWLVPATGGDPVALTADVKDAYHRSADWSPDGTRLVFESNREEGASALFIMDLETATVSRITALPGYEGHPAWSPDGARIAYESTVSGVMEIYVVDAEGGKSIPVTQGGGWWPRWSPDGSALVFGVFGDGEPNLWQVDLAP